MLTVHHLDYSRSTRVLWLMEELGVPYELVRYHRKVGGPAPESLGDVHPLRKSPVLVDDGFVLAESSAILRYVDRAYGRSSFTPDEPRARARHDEWLDYVEGSLAIPLLVPLVAGDGLPEPIRVAYAQQVTQAWRHIVDALQFSDYLMGGAITLADMQMSYMLAVASKAKMLRDHPALNSYLQRMLDRPGLARAIVAGGPMA